MNEVDFLDQLGCRDIAHLGDGLYVGFDGYQIWFAVNRNGVIHHVAMDGHSFINFIDWTKRVKVYR